MCGLRSGPTPQDGAARTIIVLVPKASGKPLRRTDLARGVPSGTMPSNRAAPLHTSSRHARFCQGAARSTRSSVVYLAPGIYERRGKDLNLRRLPPTLQLDHLRKGPEQSYEGKAPKGDAGLRP